MDTRIEDISEFVEQQRLALAAKKLNQLATPSETIYDVADEAVAERLQLDHGRGGNEGESGKACHR